MLKRTEQRVQENFGNGEQRRQKIPPRRLYNQCLLDHKSGRARLCSVTFPCLILICDDVGAARLIDPVLHQLTKLLQGDGSNLRSWCRHWHGFHSTSSAEVAHKDVGDDELVPVARAVEAQ